MNPDSLVTPSSIPYGPVPWRQTQWDARAATNFVCGGAGGGLVAFTALAQVAGPARAALFLAGLALVGAGLASVWLELGRPWRALNVFRNPRTSWMAREAIAGSALFVAGLAAAAGVAGAGWVAAAFALAFVFCQARMLHAARGIPAWRAGALVPLLVTTGLAEGAGLFWLAAPWHRAGTGGLLILFGILLVARVGAWLLYRREVGGSPQAWPALHHANLTLLGWGTLVPLVLGALVARAPLDATVAFALVAVAGLAAASAGAVFKYALILRASYNQGFALARLPVRGTRS